VFCRLARQADDFLGVISESLWPEHVLSEQSDALRWRFPLDGTKVADYLIESATESSHQTRLQVVCDERLYRSFFQVLLFLIRLGRVVLVVLIG